MTTFPKISRSAASQRVFCGTSGWAYPSWRPGFYPEKLPPRRFLSYYSSVLSSVEVNYTFTKLPTPEQVAGWLSETPQNFRFCFKVPQRITHFRRLLECDQHLAEFLALLRPVAEAGRMGLVLFQLPPNFKADVERLQGLLSSDSLAGAPPLAFEFRHPSWFTEETFSILREHGAALCVADTDELKTPEIHTAPGHTCFRMRRQGGYSAEELAGLAGRCAALAKEREVYVAFRHEEEPTGALNALQFQQLAAEANERTEAR